MFRLLAALLASTSLALAVDSNCVLQKSIPAESANRLILNTDSGAILVEPGDTRTLHVDVCFHDRHPSQEDMADFRREFVFDVARSGSTVRAEGRFRNGWGESHWIWPWSSVRNLEFRVTVPRKFDAELNTSGGPIWVRNLDGRIEAHTSGGPIHLENTTARADVHTSGGPITITDAKGAVNASTSGGPITASFVGQLGADTSLTTSGGPIHVRLSPDVRVYLDASTSGGPVSSDFFPPDPYPHNHSSLRAAINGGGPRLYLHTSGGPIRVTHQQTLY